MEKRENTSEDEAIQETWEGVKKDTREVRLKF